MDHRFPEIWLSEFSNLEQRMKMLASTMPEGERSGDTLKERAEFYYEKRPQMLALLQDLYNGYITLSDRYIQTVVKQNHHRRQTSQVSSVDNDCFSQEDGRSSVLDSDAESSLSFQQASTVQRHKGSVVLDVDAIVADLVIKNVEYDIMVHEVGAMEWRCSESARKIELQKSLLEVLESERMVLMNENAKLGYKVTTLAEENKELASESLLMRKKASELARCLMKAREEQRLDLLNRRIEELQKHIHGLEKKNKEYYEQLVNREIYEQLVHEYYERLVIGEQQAKGKSNKKQRGEMDLKICFQVEKLKFKDNSGKGRRSLWDKFKNMDLFLCGRHSTPL